MSAARRLEAAYRATEYVVEGPQGTFTLRIDEASASLAALHALYGARSSAFISACNPRSVLQSAADNDAAHTQLLQLLRRGNHACIEGWGRDPSGAWPAECSVLVPGLSLVVALELAGRFGQNAILHAGADAVPRLRWLEDSGRPAAPGTATPGN